MEVLFKRFEALGILPVLGQVDARRIWKQLGTLGGGNHFIELCLDEVGVVWVMLHSGSRFIGKTIGEAAIGMARESAHRAGVPLPDRDLAWLSEGTTEFDRYVEALRWAQDYAALNRDLMLFRVMNVLRRHSAVPSDRPRRRSTAITTMRASRNTLAGKCG